MMQCDDQLVYTVGELYFEWIALSTDGGDVGAPVPLS